MLGIEKKLKEENVKKMFWKRKKTQKKRSNWIPLGRRLACGSRGRMAEGSLVGDANSLSCFGYGRA